MKKFLTVFFALLLTACANPKKNNINFDNSFHLANDAIHQQNFEMAYRHLERYYLFDEIIKKPTPKILEMKGRIENLFTQHPEIITAGLNTFTAKSFYQTLKIKNGDKQKAKLTELVRIRIFKRISPDNYAIAASQYNKFFGQSPEDASVEFSKLNEAKRKTKGKFTNITAEGSLEVTKPLKCVDLESVTNKHSAADIFTGVEACIKDNDVTRATRLYAFALAYGRYDQLRMVDTTARAAVRALQYKYVRPPKEFAAKMKEEIKNHSAANKDSEAFTSLCSTVKQIGKPDYHPRYMIRHGMSVFTGKESGVIKDFNAEENWNKIYSQFLKCS